MKKSELNKLCTDENMINVEVRCNYGILLQMQTSWLDRILRSRFWSCPHNVAMHCKFFDGETRRELTKDLNLFFRYW
ncbi:hypothetical protein H5410_021290 [Solanum commersonii]|uniref:Uncharacterized protein n=1 Tax=Solanum commersonii TaxID=4109 RepID=A0A9J5ZAX3_SOLCO|nr:hypothetical protein H5410_021290 [Solanum commersonii]